MKMKISVFTEVLAQPGESRGVNIGGGADRGFVRWWPFEGFGRSSHGDGNIFQRSGAGISLALYNKGHMGLPDPGASGHLDLFQA